MINEANGEEIGSMITGAVKLRKLELDTTIT
jgi:hypothetical protein